MVEFITIVAYLLIFLVPIIIIGIGSLFDDRTISPILAFINFNVLVTYFYHEGAIPTWIVFSIVLVISIGFVGLLKSVFGGD